jgi:hypothetical protein
MIGFREIIRWIRANLILFLFASLVALQFLTWRSIVDLARELPRDPPDCSSYKPCMVELSEYSLRQLRSR